MVVGFQPGIWGKLTSSMISSIIIEEVIKKQVNLLEKLESTHNYVSAKDYILRKGAISAHRGERLIIPFSMSEGAVIGLGKGNKDWNYSAPHGSGRKMSRIKAKQSLDIDYLQINKSNDGSIIPAGVA